MHNKWYLFVFFLNQHAATMYIYFFIYFNSRVFIYTISTELKKMK